MDSSATAVEPVPVEPERLPTLEQLPDDPATLKHMVLELLATLQQERRDKEALRQRLDHLLRRLYGPRTERLAADQLPPAEVDADSASAPATEPTAAEAVGRRRRRARPHGRRPLPEHLPRRIVQHELTEAERLCSCGQLRVRIGVQSSEQLDWQPACLFVWEHRVHKYACQACAARPASPAPAAEPRAPESGAADLMPQPDVAAVEDRTTPTEVCWPT
jgi:transposase